MGPPKGPHVANPGATAKTRQHRFRQRTAKTEENKTIWIRCPKKTDGRKSRCSDRPIYTEINSPLTAFRNAQASAWEKDLFKQKKRLADAQRNLKEKETKRAREDERIATNKIASYIERLTDLKRIEAEPGESRIFPMYFAPVVVTDAGRRIIRPMRYRHYPDARKHCSRTDSRASSDGLHTNHYAD
jgi:hypothetical protein